MSVPSIPLVIVPAYDEAAAIAAVVRGAARHARVLVVDDGSRDATAARASEAGAEVIRHARRLGKAQAIRTGVAAARARRADLIVTMDGDGQHDPADLPALLSAAAAAPDALIVGRRQADDDALPAERRNAVRVASFFVSWVTGQRVDDSQCGFRVYPMALFAEVATRRGGFVFETEILVAAAHVGWRVVEVPITARPRAAARSRFRPYADGTRVAVFLAARVGAAWVRTGARAAAAVVHRRGSTAAPRARPALRAGVATAAAVGVLPLLAVQMVAGRRLPDVVTPLVRAVYDPERLAGRRPSSGPAAGPETLAATSP